MSDMKTENAQKCKDLIGFIVFILIIAFLFSKVTWLFRGNGAEAREDILGFDNEKCDIDVILFDGSDVLRFYDPLEVWKQYGFTSYNYATSSAQADMLKYYAEESRESCKAKLYVFDLRTITFVTDEISESTLRNWSDSVPVFSKVRAKGIHSYIYNRNHTDENIASYFFDIIKYHSKYDSLASEYQWSYMNAQNIYNVDKGFDPYKNHTPFTKPIGTEARGELSENQSNALKELVDYCDQEGLNALFICSPIIIPEEQQTIMNSVSDYIQARGYEFIDFNKYYDEIGIDFETDYGDVNHVNYYGARKFTDYFSRLIVDKYNLPDHRSDEKYGCWNQDYESMFAKRNEWMFAVQNDLNNHIEAKQQWENIHDTEDFLDWYNYIKNENYTAMVVISDMTDVKTSNGSIINLIDFWNIDWDRDYYIAVWEGSYSVYASYDEIESELSIGIDGGRGKDNCKISAENSTINIGGKDYLSDGAPIHIVVYDKNYKKVIDNVNLHILPDDSVVVKR